MTIIKALQFFYHVSYLILKIILTFVLSIVLKV